MAEGWHIGHIDREVRLDEPTPLVRFTEDCRTVPVTAGQPVPVKWVLLHFRRPHKEAYRVVPLPAGIDADEGREVYVKVTDCAQAIENR